MADTSHHRVIVVGAGFGGLAMGVALQRRGISDFVILERADGVAGTWRDNTYPGCACDVPSHLYSLSFAPNREWSRSFSGQAEIRAYIERTFDQFGIRPHVRLQHEVLENRWDDATGRWTVPTSAGTFTCEMLVLASGGLSDSQIPDLPGLADFRGEIFHSSRWRHDLDLTGRRVAVVGTGASAIQFVPAIVPKVAALHLFQRTPPWVLPRLDRKLSSAERAYYRHVPGAERLARLGVFATRELSVPALSLAPPLMGAAAAVAKVAMRRQVKDPALRAILTPDYQIGCKRILLSNAYYPALTQPHAEVIDSGVARLTRDSVISADGRERPADTVIFGTGFQIGDLPMARRTYGADGQLMSDVWAQRGMAALRGTMVAGFPNLFYLIGPNTGVGHTSIVYMIESQVRFVMDALRVMAERGDAVVDVRPPVQATWNTRLQKRLQRTVWSRGGCSSWYLNDSGQNTTLWPGSVLSFRASVRKINPSEHILTKA